MNSIGLWSDTLWSEPLSMGQFSTDLDAGEVSDILFDVSIADYDQLSANESAHALGPDDIASMLIIDMTNANGTAGLNISFGSSSGGAAGRRLSGYDFASAEMPGYVTSDYFMTMSTHASTNPSSIMAS